MNNSQERIFLLRRIIAIAEANIAEHTIYLKRNTATAEQILSISFILEEEEHTLHNAQHELFQLEMS